MASYVCVPHFVVLITTTQVAPIAGIATLVRHTHDESFNVWTVE